MQSLGAIDLGSATPVTSNDVIVKPFRLYTYRTFALVPLRESAQFKECDGWLQCFARTKQTAWQYARSMGWKVAPPSGTSSLYQAATPERRPDGANAYRTSLTFYPTHAGMKASSMKWAAVQILNKMREYEGLPDPREAVFLGHLFERAAEEPRHDTSLWDRARAFIAGETPEESARRRQQEIETEESRQTWTVVLGVLAFGLGAFMATRKGAARLEARAGRAAGGAARFGLDAARPKLNRRRRRRR
jgi:hypothetical protein